MSIRFDKSLVSGLESFGLTEKESRVYLALLPHRDIGSSKIIRATGLHGQFVYDALASLETKGLVKHVVQNGRKKFSANTPMRIVSLLDERRVAAQATARELQKRFTGAHDQDFEVFQGEHAFIAHEFASLENAPEGSSIDVIGGARDRYFETLGSDADEYERLRVGKNIKIRYLGDTSVRDRLQKLESKLKLWDYRLFPGLLTGIVDTDIWWNSIHFNMFGIPIVSFELVNKEAADGYREFFNALWNIAKRG